MISCLHCKFSISHTGVDFIRFLDLDAQDGVESQLVMPDNNNNIIENGDYFSEPIFVNTGIPLGGQGETANQLYVSYSTIAIHSNVMLHDFKFSLMLLKKWVCSDSGGTPPPPLISTDL